MSWGKEILRIKETVFLLVGLSWCIKITKSADNVFSFFQSLARQLSVGLPLIPTRYCSMGFALGKSLLFMAYNQRISAKLKQSAGSLPAKCLTDDRLTHRDNYARDLLTLPRKIIHAFVILLHACPVLFHRPHDHSIQYRF